MVQWCWANFQCRGVLLIWIRVGQGPSVLAVGAGGGCLDIFSLVYHFSFSFSLGDGPIWTEILSQRAVKPKKNNQKMPSLDHFWANIFKAFQLTFKTLKSLCSKIYILEYSHFRSCQDQPKVKMCTVLVVLQYPMLHIKFQGN